MLLRRNHLYVFQQKQSGAALILIAFLLALMAGAYMVKSLQGMTAQRKQDEKTMQALNEAKAALIAWSVSHQYTPGQMPWPDRGTDGNYDGSSDCVTTPFQNSYLLGQLPHLPTTSPCLDPNTGLNIYAGLSTYPGIGQEFLDAQANRIWYAVSKNLVYDYETSTAPIINPSIVNSSTWLKVLDRNGNLISDRVAVVLMAPGAPLPNQNRSGIAASTAYLDAFEIGLASYNNHTYAIAANEFVMGEDYKHVPDSDTTFTKPYLFNDKLVFITIDELIAALEKRVGQTVKTALINYESTNGNYPFASFIEGTGPANGKYYRCTTGNLTGALPIDSPSDICTYSASNNSVSTSCNFRNITSVEFQGTTNSFNQASGLCTRAGSVRCTCTGAGMCWHTTNPSTFSCDANGNCSGVNLSGSQRIRFLGSSFDTSTSFCTLGTLSTACPRPTGYRVATCNNSPATVRPQVTLSNSCSDSISTLPSWFTVNRWQDFVFYNITRPTNNSGINLGAKPAGAVVITTGKPIINSPFSIKGSAQTRPSCAINNYLDSAENTDNDNSYEPTNRPRSANYNDQIFAVEP